ncbi:MAG: hypothetical protein ACI828_001018 [Flavobacteriales bacterium]|jgi:hypothetical protein
MERKFERKVTQTHPTNPTGNTNQLTNDFNIRSLTIKEQQTKK